MCVGRQEEADGHLAFLDLQPPEVIGNQGSVEERWGRPVGEHTIVKRAWLLGHIASPDRVLSLSQIMEAGASWSVILDQSQPCLGTR